ncbi:GntR family transcriptional regulator [Catenovulum agarivorans DS-2]|uniref:GntR family transcriptional regulator n=1 Tax=Catenovulum agarivorans DS-2 TaxID=1328313 RepID=W7QD19_9ALTE|nr:FadR/GntR family transcriptional regulator [Catenovulum agarivorans]EWH09811.1 GntR family transcriptional regulator [Catenovulum agarivorans DS-2]
MPILERNNSLSQRMVAELGRAIVCGEYTSETGLPSEADLCEQFGVSRTAVREAVKMLSAKGLITSRQRQGISVLPKSSWNLLDSEVLSWSLKGEVSLQVIREYLQMRKGIEPQAAALAAQTADVHAIAKIEQAVGKMRIAAESGDPKAELEADIEFHISVLLATKNRFYIHMKEFTSTALRASIQFTSPVKADPIAVVEEHEKIYQAIKSGNSERARNIMYMLIDEAISFVEAKIDQ